MIKSNFHTHTNLTDGRNEAEDMILAAIAAGFDTLGFSEHAYVPFDPECSLSKDTTLFYRSEIARLKAKYADKINILCGLEMDYYSEDDVEKYDYAIGSVHYIKVAGKIYSVDLSADETIACVKESFGGNLDGYAECYFEHVADVKRKTGANIIGHFDLITKFAEKGVVFDAESPRYQRAWKAAMNELAGKVPFEINTGAVARGYRSTPYPAPDMLEELYKMGGSVILSSDCHDKKQIDFGLEDAAEYAKSKGFTSGGFTDKNDIFYRQDF